MAFIEFPPGRIAASSVAHLSSTNESDRRSDREEYQQPGGQAYPTNAPDAVASAMRPGNVRAFLEREGEARRPADGSLRFRFRRRGDVLLHRRDEGVSSFRNGPHVARILGIVPQRLPDRSE